MEALNILLFQLVMNLFALIIVVALLGVLIFAIKMLLFLLSKKFDELIK